MAAQQYGVNIQAHATSKKKMHFKGDTFLIIGLLVGTTVTLSLYILSDSVLSVAAIPVIPQSFGNCCHIVVRHANTTQKHMSF